ncbi:MAG: dihydroorotate dehydrogenase electron transfer subunit, partial [Clostridiales bacterium]|nr:dihydroorotate dehydrogenase electron transfer subunit [Clostridiales bacterium]
IGGGAGVPPLYALAKRLLAQGKQPRAILGFNRGEECFLVQEFQALGVPVTIATADGSLGVKGFVTDAMPSEGYTYVYTCGPEPMLKAIDGKAVTSGQFSFEERMGCGFGACMGCTCKTKYGNKRICREGPVLEREEILW